MLKWLRRPQPIEWPPEFDQLARYNSERMRGIVHTSEWQSYMRAVQERFLKQQHGDKWELFRDQILPLLLEPKPQ